MGRCELDYRDQECSRTYEDGFCRGSDESCVSGRCERDDHRGNSERNEEHCSDRVRNG